MSQWCAALRKASHVQNLPHTSGDNVKAAEAVEKLASAACQRSGLAVKIWPLTKAPQFQTLEHELMKSIEELTTWRRIIGTPLTVDKILHPQEEKNIGQSGELVEVESDGEDEDDQPKLEAACIERLGADSSLDLVHKLWAFRATLWHEELQNAKQVTLDKFWNTK
ncbi:hypothetical protein C8R48DRAFT_672644 [Suillus tomentosus]|nr:hypothetical protein C8R48DRAFT_672644 [Suillus tomentosus]